MSIMLEQLSKEYAGLIVVDGVSLDISDGELFVLLGTSGSGKSTILRLIAGLAQPDRGRVLLHGRDVTRLPPQERGTGFVFQNYSIFRHMSVAKNIEFGLKIRKTTAAERVQRRDQLLHLHESYRRLRNAHEYKVGLTYALWRQKEQMLSKFGMAPDGA